MAVITLDGIIFSLQSHGGISVYFSELARRVSRSGINMEWLLFDKQSVPCMGDACRGIRYESKRLAERYRRCRTSSDTVLFHSSYYRLPQSAKIPVITTVHDFTYERCCSGIRRLVHSAQKSLAIREASAVICVSENTRNDLLDLFPDISTNKVSVIYNGVSDDFFPLETNCRVNNHRPFVLFVGSRSGYKNFSAVVESLKLLDTVELVCVGGGRFTSSERMLLEKVIPGGYYHEGLVTNKRLNYLYNNALCLLYPSLYEGFGIPVVEAMRAGCPVVATNSSSIPEVAGDAAILLETVDPELIAQSLERIAERYFRNELIQKGFKQSQMFSWDESYRQTMNVYEAVLGHTLL